jgi:hypothetical protein
MEMTDEKRSQKREEAKYCYHAEIRLIGVPVYEVKIKDLSSNGASILVKKDSLLLNHLGIGKTISVKYYLGDRSKAFGPYKANIKHLTQFEAGRFKGHFSAGLAVSVRDATMKRQPE